MSNTTTDNIGERIKKIRKERGLTQMQVSSMAKVAHKTYVSWEKGTSIPRLDTLSNLCNALQCEPDYILNGITHDTHCNVEIFNELGLSDKAIHNIKRIHDLGKIGDRYLLKAPAMETLNSILESDELFDLVQSICTYSQELPTFINDPHEVNHRLFDVEEIFKRIVDEVSDYHARKKALKPNKKSKLF